GDGRARRRCDPDRSLPDPPRRHPVPVPPRVLPLVALPDPWMGLERRDRLRPICLRELPTARTGPAAFRSPATGPRRLAPVRTPRRVARDVDQSIERGNREMETRSRDDEVVAPHEGVEIRDRLRDFRTHASVGLVGERDLRHDALRREMFEERLAALEPDEMAAQAHEDPRSPLRYVAPQLGPERSRPRAAKHVTTRPRVAGVIVG